MVFHIQHKALIRQDNKNNKHPKAKNLTKELITKTINKKPKVGI